MNDPDLNWHDGILREITWNDETEVQILIDLYPEPIDSRERSKYRVICKNVTESLIKLDSVELRDNRGAGNINSGGVENGILKIDLFGGEICVNSESIEARAC